MKVKRKLLDYRLDYRLDIKLLFLIRDFIIEKNIRIISSVTA